MVTNKLPTLGINELLEESTARDFFFFFRTITAVNYLDEVGFNTFNSHKPKYVIWRPLNLILHDRLLTRMEVSCSEAWLDI